MSSKAKRNVAGWMHAVDKCETRNDDGTQRTLQLAGYAALFNNPSERMGRIVETIDPRAFDEVLATKPDVRFQIEHNGLALARTSNNTLRLRVDQRGLYFEADLNPGVQASRDLYALVERGDITQMSFGFTIGDEKVDDRGDTIRAHITRVDNLFEISAVTFPAYNDTTVLVVPIYEEHPDDDEDTDDDMMNDDELLSGRSDRSFDAPLDDGYWEVDLAAARRRREAFG
jgi:HK97 family phage prohead protease